MSGLKHGGPRKGAGRKPKPVSERAVVITVRLTPARRDKLRQLGSAWLASAIDAAEL